MEPLDQNLLVGFGGLREEVGLVVEELEIRGLAVQGHRLVFDDRRVCRMLKDGRCLVRIQADGIIRSRACKNIQTLEMCNSI